MRLSLFASANLNSFRQLDWLVCSTTWKLIKPTALHLESNAWNRLSYFHTDARGLLFYGHRSFQSNVVLNLNDSKADKSNSIGVENRTYWDPLATLKWYRTYVAVDFWTNHGGWQLVGFLDAWLVLRKNKQWYLGSCFELKEYVFTWAIACSFKEIIGQVGSEAQVQSNYP